MKRSLLATVILSALLFSCSENSSTKSGEDQTPTFQNKGHRLVYDMVQKVGNYKTLFNKKDVIYTYTYQLPDGKTNISTEKYIFDGELSYGVYSQHDRTFPDLEGEIEQAYDGKEYWLKHQGKILNDPDRLKNVAFSRPTNFYWFSMFQKLLDPSVKYEHLGGKIINDMAYDIVKITFDTKDEKPTDIYQLYINKKTQLVDQFLFTVADFGIMETPKLMKLEYEKIDGILIPSKRLYKSSTWNADVNDDPWIKATWSNIRFNNGLTKQEFEKKHTMKNDNKVSLKSQLDEKKEAFELKADEQKKRVYKEGLESVLASGILDKSLNVGDMAPNFKLKNALGETVDLYSYLKKGKVVLTWYRGGWCPYCNITLHQLQEELPNFKANGANLIALTPEVPDKSLSTSEKHDLKFEVLSDLGNKVAKEYGIVFKLTDEVAKIYNDSFDMNGYNGDDSNELPLAATYIINEDGKIIYAFLDVDYRNRAEPSELTQILKKN